jgi:hypothetical protein
MDSINAIDDLFSPVEGGELGEFEHSQAHVSAIHGSRASTNSPSIEQEVAAYDDPP